MKRITFRHFVAGGFAIGLAMSTPAHCETKGAPQSSDALFQSARSYLLGHGVKKDSGKALELMKQAAALGNADAIGGVGYFYSVGLGVERDDRVAVEWFQKGADSGSAKAELNLGQMYLAGRGVERNSLKGVEWMQKAADQNLMEAHVALAELYLLGELSNRVPDYPKTFEHAKFAAESGNPHAENTMGVLSEHGYATEMSLPAAQLWYRKAAEQGLAKAQSNLARVLDPKNPDPRIRKEALMWLILAADQNEPVAVRTLPDLQSVVASGEIDEARKSALKWRSQRRVAGQDPAQ